MPLAVTYGVVPEPSATSRAKIFPVFFAVKRESSLKIFHSPIFSDKNFALRAYRAAASEARTAHGAVQKETGSPNYFKFTREFKSAKI